MAARQKKMTESTEMTVKTEAIVDTEIDQNLMQESVETTVDTETIVENVPQVKESLTADEPKITSVVTEPVTTPVTDFSKIERPTPQSGIPRKPIFFTNLFTSIESGDYPFNFPQNVIGRDDKGTRALVKLANMKPEQAEIFRAFMMAIGANPTNAGLALYDADNIFSYYTAPQLGKLGAEIGVMVGAKHGTEEKSDFIPLVLEDGTYTLNGRKVTMYGLMNPETKVSTPYLLLKTESYVFHIGVKYDRELVTFEHIDQAFDSGGLHLFVSSFFGNYIAYNKMFQHLFKTDKFPLQGVLMHLVDGKLQTGGEWVSSRWKIAQISTSQALLMVQDKDKNLMKLEEVEGLYIPSSGQPTKMLMDDETIDSVWLHSIGAHKQKRPDFDWIPHHSCTTQLARLTPKVQQAFEPMIQEYLQLQPAVDF